MDRNLKRKSRRSIKWFCNKNFVSCFSDYNSAKSFLYNILINKRLQLPWIWFQFQLVYTVWQDKWDKVRQVKISFSTKTGFWIAVIIWQAYTVEFYFSGTLLFFVWKSGKMSDNHIFSKWQSGNFFYHFMYHLVELQTKVSS